MGRRGSGKTRLALALLPRLDAHGIIVSPLPLPYPSPWPVAAVGAGPAGRDGLAAALRGLRDFPGAWIVLDDAETILDQYVSMRDEIARDVSLLRNRGLSAILVTKAPSLLAPWIRAQADVLVYRPWREPVYERWLSALGAPTDPPADPAAFYWGPDSSGEWRTASPAAVDDLAAALKC